MSVLVYQTKTPTTIEYKPHIKTNKDIIKDKITHNKARINIAVKLNIMQNTIKHQKKIR